MSLPTLSFPDDLASAHTALLEEREARLRAEAEATSAKAKLPSIEALNAHLQLLIAKLERDKHSPSRERTQRLIDQMELQLEELVADATEDELASQAAAAKTRDVHAFTRKRPVRKPWPETIERERVVIDAPNACDQCGSERLSKLGEDTTETLADVSRTARRGKGLRPVSATALEAVKRIDALFAIEREINGRNAEDRLAARQEKSKPLLDELEAWFRLELEGLSRWDDFARYADDGRICMTKNAAERALLGVACFRKNWNFAGSDRGADRAAIMLTLITTARLNDIDPKAWLSIVLARIADLPVFRLHELLPWEWKAISSVAIPAAA